MIVDPNEFNALGEYGECSESEPHFCRICYGNENSRDLQLISPCACKGSISHVHKQCLMKWVRSGLALKKAGSTIECEICKAELPLQLNHLPYLQLLQQPYRSKLLRPTLTLGFHFGALQIFRKLEWQLIQALQTKRPRNILFRILDCFTWHLFGPFRYQISLLFHLLLVYKKKRSIKQLLRHSVLGGVFCFVWTLFFFYFHVVLKKGISLWNQICILRKTGATVSWKSKLVKSESNLFYLHPDYSVERHA